MSLLDDHKEQLLVELHHLLDWVECITEAVPDDDYEALKELSRHDILDHGARIILALKALAEHKTNEALKERAG